MNPDRWRLVTELFHAALEHQPSVRATFLHQACSADPSLEADVNALLAAHEQVDEAGDPFPGFSRRLRPGTRLGPYEIETLVGAGGMGEVYKARDTRLNRTVALKILSAPVSDDAEFRARFVREAHAIAALNHPHICTLHDVGDQDGIEYLVMEYLHGETLAAQLQRGRLPIERSLKIAADVASALDKAHRLGIVHRDLKPANLMFTDDGEIKVLDLGLARSLSETTPATAPDFTTAATRMLTNHGIIVGTVGYMSPEQASGKAALAASDQFSFGMILYEMLTGQPAFERDTPMEGLAAILHDEPEPIATLNPVVPAALQQIVQRCLAKDPAARFASTGDLLTEIEKVKESFNAAEPAGASANRRTVLRFIGASIAVVVGAVATRRLWSGPSTIRVLAVLPFANPANDEEVEYLCDGLTEGLIQRIARLSSLRVMARSTVFNFKGKAIDPRDVGRQLGVDAVLTGSVARHSGRLVVSVELVDATTGAQIWSNLYDRPSTDVLLVQEDIVKSIVEDGVKVQLGADDRLRMAQRPTSDPLAYELYLRARHAIQKDTSEDYLRARALLQQALERDARFAAAHALLSGTYALMVLAGFERPTEAWPQALKSASRALALDPDSPEAHREAAGIAFFFEWDWPRAEREWKTSTESRGGSVDPDSLVSYALGCWALGRPADAVRLARDARERDPLTPAFTLRLANYLLYSGGVEEAITLYEKAIADDPRDDRAYFGLAQARHAQRRFDEALEARRLGAVAAGDTALLNVFPSERGEVGYRQLELVTAQLELDSLRTRAAAAAYVSALDFARAYAQLGATEQAFSYFPAAFADRVPDLVFLNVERQWDSIRHDLRFKAAVHRVGLA
jgi:eukaryotic-like serine/threonine-protein kinase